MQIYKASIAFCAINTRFFYYLGQRFVRILKCLIMSGVGMSYFTVYLGYVLGEGKDAGRSCGYNMTLHAVEHAVMTQSNICVYVYIV